LNGKERKNKKKLKPKTGPLAPFGWRDRHNSAAERCLIDISTSTKKLDLKNGAS